MSLNQFLRGYDGIGPPDEKEKERVCAPTQLLKEAFRKWALLVESNVHRVPKPSYEKLDMLVEEARRIIAPHDKDLPEIIDEEAYFLPIKLFLEQDYQQYGGLFYSALLTQERTIDVPTIIESGHWGYKMNTGKVILRGNSSECIGYKAAGGTIINYGTIMHDLADRSSGGIFINKGYANYFGFNTTGGLCINEGDAALFGRYSRNSIFVNKGIATCGAMGAMNVFFVNYGKICELGSNAVGGTIITTTSWYGPFLNYAANTIGITPTELKNKELDNLLACLRKVPYSELKKDSEIEQLAGQITSLIKTNEKALPFHKLPLQKQSWQVIKGIFIDWYYRRNHRNL